MKAQIVSFHCVLRNKLGTVLGSTFNNEVLTDAAAGGGDNMLKGLAEGLRDLKKGERRQITLGAKEAYGFYDLKQVVAVPREGFPGEKRLKVGDQVVCAMNGGPNRKMRVIELDGIEITLDGNHPLAGQDLIFEIEALEARDATPDEVGVEETGTGTDLH